MEEGTLNPRLGSAGKDSKERNRGSYSIDIHKEESGGICTFGIQSVVISICCCDGDDCCIMTLSLDKYVLCVYDLECAVNESEENNDMILYDTTRHDMTWKNESKSQKRSRDEKTKQNKITTQHDNKQSTNGIHLYFRETHT